jgi:hypothetical protein
MYQPRLQKRLAFKRRRLTDMVNKLYGFSRTFRPPTSKI